MTFTVKDWIALVVSSLFAYLVFGNISSKAGYPRWHGLLMALPFVKCHCANRIRILHVAH